MSKPKNKTERADDLDPRSDENDAKRIDVDDAKISGIVKEDAMSTIGSIRAFDQEYQSIEKADVHEFAKESAEAIGRNLNWWENPQTDKNGSFHKLGEDHFNIQLLDEVSDEEYEGIDIRKVLIIASKAVFEVYEKLNEMLGKKMDTDLSNKDLFYTFQITPGESLAASISGGGPIQIGVKRLKKLIIAYKSGDAEQFEQALARFCSQLFHELFHQLPEVDGDNINNTHEEITMFAEFLYDPKNNREGNEIFREFGERINEDSSNFYHNEYRKVTSKLLLWELFKRKKVDAGQRLDDYSSILGNIDKYFRELSVKERLQMIVDVLPCNNESIAAQADKIKEEMKLPF